MEDQNYIEHYGVKGMKWGVRKRKDSNSNPKGSRTARRQAAEIIRYDADTRAGRARAEVTNKANKKIHALAKKNPNATKKEAKKLTEPIRQQHKKELKEINDWQKRQRGEAHVMQYGSTRAAYAAQAGQAFLYGTSGMTHAAMNISEIRAYNKAGKKK